MSAGDELKKVSQVDEAHKALIMQLEALLSAGRELSRALEELGFLFPAPEGIPPQDTAKEDVPSCPLLSLYWRYRYLVGTATSALTELKQRLPL